MTATAELTLVPAVLRGDADGTAYPIVPPRNADSAGGLLSVERDLSKLDGQALKETWDARLGSREFPYRSGVWRYRELIAPFPDEDIVSAPEGNTNLYCGAGMDRCAGCRTGGCRLARWAGVERLALKHEGENPTASFKDRGMTAAISHARHAGATTVACASSGNTSASLAAYAAKAGMRALTFIPEGKITAGKLGQTLAYGAQVVQVRGDFDAAMALVQQVAETMPVFLANNINPFRLEGQKSIAFEILQQRGWVAPDWLVLPGGNLGNTSAIGKGFIEAYQLGIIGKLPRFATVQAAGAAPFAAWFEAGFDQYEPVQAETVASAIRIGNPVSRHRARKIIERTGGVVLGLPDSDLLAAKLQIDHAGIGCEPASAASLAGIKALRERGIIQPGDDIVGILTGHVLKDAEATERIHLSGPDARPPIVIPPTLAAVQQVLANG
jgi:threonine synthase